MTVRDAINRGYNLVGTAIVAITGFAFFAEFFTEDELTHKLDEGVLFLLALGSIAWYLIGKNKFSRTIVPILFTAAALIMKLLAFFVFEAGDAADLGDEFGAMILFVITLAFLIWQYVSIKRMAAKEAAEVKLVASSR
jgi:FtsH-binding integral membrane protein